MVERTESFHVRVCRLFAAAAAWLAIATGIAVLVGWWLHLDVLTSVLPGLAAMKPNTAACFILAGTSLWLYRIRPGGSTNANLAIAKILAGAVALVGLATLVEHLLGVNLHIDDLLFHQTLAHDPYHGQMSMGTACGLFLLGGSLLLLDLDAAQKRHTAQGLALLVVAVGVLVSMGYFYGPNALYRFKPFAHMAILTALLFLMLGCGVLFTRPHTGLLAVMTSRYLGGLMARRLLPILGVLSVVIGWLRVHGQKAGWYQPEFGAAIFSSAVLFMVVSLVWFCALWLNRADQARRRAEQRDEELAAIVDSSSDAIIGKTLDGVITSWNKGAERIYGYREDEMLGKSVSVLVPPGHSDEIPQLLAEIGKGNPVELLETVRRRQDGTQVDISLIVSPVHDAEGNVIGASAVARDITQQRQAEKKLQESQAQLKGIIDSAMDAVVTVDSTQRIVMFNAAAEKMFRCSAADVMGSPLERLIPARFQRAHAGHINKFDETGVTNRTMGTLGSLSGLRADGEEFPIEASISQIDSRGKRLFTAIVRDVTERVRADHALREQARVLDLAQVLVRDMEDRIVLWNHGAERLYGFTLEEALGRNAHELLHTEFPEPLETIYKKLKHNGEWEGELVHRKRDGSRIVVASVWTLDRHVNGQPLRILEANTDITGRKRAEEDMQLAKARLVSALEGGRMGTWVWDVGHQVIWDDAMSALFGRSPQELASGSIDPFFSWVHPQDRERARANIDDALREGASYESEYRVFRPNQSVIWIASRGRVERDAYGRAFRLTGVCVDITDRKKIEEQLVQSQKMQALGTLAGGIAHDFNNILLAIGGNANLALEDLSPDHPARDSVQDIVKASGRASSLVRQILAFSRRQSPDRKLIRLQPVVEEALALLRATLPARIEIHTSFSPDLPTISADSTQLHQVIMNLGTNAARAMGDHAGVLKATARPLHVTPEFAAGIAKLRAGYYVLLSISDTGRGMDKATMDRIFDPFFTTQAPGQGTGLGLSVVHGIVKDHDGSISVYSEPGKGTIFHLYFPAAQQSEEKTVVAVPPPRGSGEHLLYVDDEEALVMLAKRSLTRLGYRITGHTDPLRALAAFRENPGEFAAVVTDLSMPGMSGAELARQLLEIRSDIPIVVMSGYIRPEDEQEAQRIGVHDIILKPDTIEELAKSLRQAFNTASVKPAGPSKS